MTSFSEKRSVKKYILYCLGFILLSVSVQGQYKDLLHKPYYQKVNDIHNLYVYLLNFKSDDSLKNALNEITALAKKENDKELEYEVQLFKAYNRVLKFPDSSKSITDGLTQLIAKSEKEHLYHIKIRALRVLAEYYWEKKKDYEKAFEFYYLLEQDLSKITPSNYPDMVYELLKIGQSFYFFQDYQQAKKYLFRAINLPETKFNTIYYNSALNTLGLCYQKESKYDSSNFYLRKIYNTPFDTSQKAWGGIASGDIGANVFYCGDYENAIPLLKVDYDGALKELDCFRIVTSGLKLAEIYYTKKLWTESHHYLDTVFKYIHIGKIKDELRLYYPILSKWYMATGESNLAAIYLDSSIIAVNRYEEKYSGLKLLRVQQKIDNRDAALKSTAINLAKQKLRTNQIIIITLLIAGSFISVLIYLFQKKKQLVTKYKLQKAEFELTETSKNIKQFVAHIAEKNLLIEELQKSNAIVDKNIMIQQLRKSTILTEEEWQNFQSLFEKIHPDYVNKTRNQFPQLTTSELRYFVLTKLKLSYKEISSMLGVSPNTVQVLRHRIRKKLNLQDNEALGILIDKI